MRLHTTPNRLRELVRSEPDAAVTAGQQDLVTPESTSARPIATSTQILDSITEYIDVNNFPVKEIVKFGWISGSTSSKRAEPYQVLKEFLSSSNVSSTLQAMLRHEQTTTQTDDVATQRTRGARLIWLIRVLSQADSKWQQESRSYPQIDRAFLRNIAKLSTISDGPVRAVRELQQCGVPVVVEKHLSYSRLDGAAVLGRDGMPVIGLTLRHDRIDSFWFTLLHELAHTMLHLRGTHEFFIDDLENLGDATAEKEADFVAREALVPSKIWNRSLAARTGNRASIEEVARRAEVHPAIVAGRYRYETQRYSQLAQFVNAYKVRYQFFDE